MWSILTDKLPDAIEYEGIKYDIDTRTSTALNCIRKMRQDIPQELATTYVLSRLGLPVELGALVLAMDYLAGPNTGERKKGEGGPPSFDYYQDATLIYSAFQQSYGLSLTDITGLHWWAFLALLEGLPADTRLMEVINVRTMEIDPKDSAELKAKKRRAKAAVALVDTRTEAEKKRDVQNQINSLGL